MNRIRPIIFGIFTLLFMLLACGPPPPTPTPEPPTPTETPGFQRGFTRTPPEEEATPIAPPPRSQPIRYYDGFTQPDHQKFVAELDIPSQQQLPAFIDNSYTP